MSSSSISVPIDVSAATSAVAAAVDAAIQSGDLSTIPDASVQQLLTTAARLYATRSEQGEYLPATPPAALNATQCMIVTSALLRAVNVQLFELGLWQSWS